MCRINKKPLFVCLQPRVVNVQYCRRSASFVLCVNRILFYDDDDDEDCDDKLQYGILCVYVCVDTTDEKQYTSNIRDLRKADGYLGAIIQTSSILGHKKI
jgi:hypothetical protein